MLIFLFSIFIHSAHAADSTTKISDVTPVEPIVVEGKATFESLNQDSILPKRSVSLLKGDSSKNPNLTQELGERLAFPLKNYGYTSGGQGVNLGGRSIEDTQVSTLGVPLALPQGGGADLSMFPSFLWSGFEISSGPSQAGFTQQAASGNLELKLWTREILIQKSTKQNSELTGYADRRLQSFSIGSKYSTAAVKVGAELGDQEGPSGSISWILNRTANHQVILHVLGSDLKSSPTGSIQFPSPNAKQKIWRIIPVLETSHKLSADVSLQSTLFADIHRFKYDDPSSFNSDTRTYQYGIENALVFDEYTLGLSGRYVRLDSSYFPNHDEFPLHASLLREIQVNEDTVFAGSMSVDYVNLVGVGYGAKIGLRKNLSEEHNVFGELRTLPKFPSLSARYYQLGTQFIGYPNLKPEQVSFFTLGHEFKNNQKWKATSYVKAEYRQKVQVLSGGTMDNAGSAYLFSLNQDLEAPIQESFTVYNSAMFSKSKLQSLAISYPDLPTVSDRVQFSFHPEDLFVLNAFAQFIGDSQTVGPADHPGYELFDTSLSKTFDFIFPKLQLSAGIQNIFDRRAEVVMGFPLPGRLFYASVSANF